MSLSPEKMGIDARLWAAGARGEAIDPYYIHPTDLLFDLHESYKPYDSYYAYWCKVERENGFGMITSLRLKNKAIVPAIVPFGLFETKAGNENHLQLVGLTPDGLARYDLNTIRGFSVVRGNRAENPYEYDGELLASFIYINPTTQRPEAKPRRVRVSGLMYGIHGKPGLTGEPTGHRKLGEWMSYYLVGWDTQYNPYVVSTNYGVRHFPLWRVRHQADLRTVNGRNVVFAESKGKRVWGRGEINRPE